MPLTKSERATVVARRLARLVNCAVCRPSIDGGAIFCDNHITVERVAGQEPSLMLLPSLAESGTPGMVATYNNHYYVLLDWSGRASNNWLPVDIVIV